MAGGPQLPSTCAALLEPGRCREPGARGRCHGGQSLPAGGGTAPWPPCFWDPSAGSHALGFVWCCWKGFCDFLWHQGVLELGLKMQLPKEYKTLACTHGLLCTLSGMGHTAGLNGTWLAAVYSQHDRAQVSSPCCAVEFDL